MAITSNHIHPVLCPFEPEPCSCAFNGRLTADERFPAADSKRVPDRFHTVHQNGEVNFNRHPRHTRLALEPANNGHD